MCVNEAGNLEPLGLMLRPFRAQQFTLIVLKANAADYSYSTFGPKDCAEFNKLDVDLQYVWILGIYTGYNLAKGYEIKDRDFQEDHYLVGLVRTICLEHEDVSPEVIVKLQIDKWVEEDKGE